MSMEDEISRTSARFVDWLVHLNSLFDFHWLGGISRTSARFADWLVHLCCSLCLGVHALVCLCL